MSHSRTYFWEMPEEIPEESLEQFPKQFLEQSPYGMPGRALWDEPMEQLLNEFCGNPWKKNLWYSSWKNVGENIVWSSRRILATFLCRNCTLKHCIERIPQLIFLNKSSRDFLKKSLKRFQEQLLEIVSEKILEEVQKKYVRKFKNLFKIFWKNS